MNTVYDFYGNIRQNRLFLANPQKKYIGEIGNPKSLHYHPKLNEPSELTFIIHEYENGSKTEFYDKIESTRLIELENLGWFEIIDPKDTIDGVDNFKEIKCFSLEYQLVSKRVDNLNGVFSLYNTSDTAKSIMHIISEASGWGIGHIDSTLLPLFRTLSIDTAQVYNVLTGDLSKSFNCIFRFDTYNKTISAYEQDNVGQLTDIIISQNNLLQSATVTSYGNKIITKLRVLGGSNGDYTVDIRDINPTGTDYIVNLNHYKVKISEGGWMTDGLVDGLDNYQDVYNSYIASHTSLINSLKTKKAELTVLNAELSELISQQKSQWGIVSEYQKNNNGAPKPDNPIYSLYVSARNSWESYNTPITNKKSSITSKTNEINSIQTQIDNITSALDINNFLTSEQIAERDTFLIENDEYQDSTFVQTSTMTNEEVISMKQQLLVNGENELELNSHPQYLYDITASNLLSMMDERDTNVSNSLLRSQLEVGNFITIKIRDDWWITSRIIELDIDFDNIENLGITLSEKTRRDSRENQFADLVANAGRASASLSFNMYGYNTSSSMNTQVSNFLNNDLNLATKNIVNNDNQECVVDTYGYLMRKWLPDQNKFDDKQSRWMSNILLFTDDNWQTSKAGIGEFTNGSGQTYYGILADVICGQLIFGNQLTLTNASGTYTWNDSGMNASATVSGNLYGVKLNPSTPLDIFSISVNGTRRFYIDTVNNKLVFTGDITGATGTFSGIVSGGSINIGNGAFTVSNDGNVFIGKGSIQLTADSDSQNLIKFIYNTRSMNLSSSYLSFNDSASGKHVSVSPDVLVLSDGNSGITSISNNGYIQIMTSQGYGFFSIDNSGYTYIGSGSAGTAFVAVGSDGGNRIFSNAIYTRTYSSGATMTCTNQGTIGIISSASRYKIDQQPYETSKSILDLTPKSWFDKTASEQYADYLTKTSTINPDGTKKKSENIDIDNLDIPVLERCYGLIAEDLEKLGLEKYVVYNYKEDGTKETQSIMYERLWIELVPIIKQQQIDIENLKSIINNLNLQNTPLT